ncbi:hypothetical protein BDB00DRAFT_852943 [Zychaea mexicana]|uniref:uncharacterized protein n=1 Tax=Zychaea mexicana TaxID=64656 RepID=UPI0022FDF9BE|nr:uncharacterized protein BDB00DRAFT_852943 [Zychaea mexicana]KAI9484869.1 hypothetical protein BDB00DRAFT_852943 [Zychaea mexicana]
MHQKRARLYKPQKRLVTRIEVPMKKVPPPPATTSATTTTNAVSSSLASSSSKRSLTSTSSAQNPLQQHQHQQQQQQQPPGTGRPARTKGPCQACHESSDGCMRKAFNWPFPSNAVFNDKGRPYVYLCNKCGLRYNKSGGCVCRNCRWVLCKDEKRNASQHIAYMRRGRPEGRVGPDDDIVDFVCSPKYWSCGRPWKVGWIPQGGEFDEEGDVSVEEDDDERPLFTHATNNNNS